MVKSLLGILAKVKCSVIAAPQLRKEHQRDGNSIIYILLEEGKMFLLMTSVTITLNTRTLLSYQSIQISLGISNGWNKAWSLTTQNMFLVCFQPS